VNFTLDINVNFPGLVAFFTQLQGTVMDQLQILQSKVDELVASNTELAAKVEEGNGKTDELILVASTTKDALVALQGQSAPDFQPLIDKLQGVIDKQTLTKASIAAQEAETGAAAVGVAP
jgi:low affinity Fe/Cu permease